MTVQVNPPPRPKLPRSFIEDREIRAWSEQLQQIVFQLYNRTGGNVDNLGQALNDIITIFGELTELDELRPLINKNTRDIMQILSAEQEVVTTSTNVTTTGNQIIKCTGALAVTLNATPDDREAVSVIVTNGDVTIDGNGKNIDGEASLDVVFKNIQAPATVDCRYLIDLDEWVLF